MSGNANLIDTNETRGHPRKVIEAKNIRGLTALGSEEHDSIVLACLKSRWLSYGTDPSSNIPETHRFELFNSESLVSLHEYFRSGSHRIREGVVFRDLAFVQQVDMGDEWLVLMRQFDDGTGECSWLPFESYSFGGLLHSRARFECAIQALHDRDPYDTAVLLGSPSRQRQIRENS